VGSYTYQYKTRDSLGFAMKATWCQVNGEARPIFKQPKTDDGTKNSLNGLLHVHWNPVAKRYTVMDNVDLEFEEQSDLIPVFINGNLYNGQSFKEIRERLAAYDE
jgi:nicotinamide phosphoribosyltransferase